LIFKSPEDPTPDSSLDTWAGTVLAKRTGRNTKRWSFQLKNTIFPPSKRTHLPKTLERALKWRECSKRSFFEMIHTFLGLNTPKKKEESAVTGRICRFLPQKLSFNMLSHIFPHPMAMGAACGCTGKTGRLVDIIR
jgi:hypothetical protein